MGVKATEMNESAGKSRSRGQGTIRAAVASGSIPSNRFRVSPYATLPVHVSRPGPANYRLLVVLADQHIPLNKSRGRNKGLFIAQR
jgi:hypothetical protein